MFFGSFDYEEMNKADATMAPAFFIIYMFLVIFILRNIFIAILERAYEKVRDSDRFKIESKVSCFSAIFAYIINRIKGDKKTPKSLSDEILYPVENLILNLDAILQLYPAQIFGEINAD